MTLQWQDTCCQAVDTERTDGASWIICDLFNKDDITPANLAWDRKTHDSLHMLRMPAGDWKWSTLGIADGWLGNSCAVEFMNRYDMPRHFFAQVGRTVTLTFSKAKSHKVITDKIATWDAVNEGSVVTSKVANQWACWSPLAWRGWRWYSPDMGH